MTLSCLLLILKQPQTHTHLGVAVWWTMVPASMLVGVCAAPLWTAQSDYVTTLAKEYARLKHQNDESVIALFSGIFYMITMIHGIFMSIISSTVLQHAPPENYTALSDDELALCGINDCPGNNVTHINFQKPAQKLVWTLVGIYICITVIGLTVCIVFVDKIPSHLLNDSSNTNIKLNLMATCHQTARPMQLLLIPITMYLGMGHTFKVADWNKSYVTCSLGIWMIGYITIAFSVSCAAIAFVSGRLVKFTGRIPMIICGILIDLGLILTYFLWKPDPDQPALFFVIYTVAGITEGLWRPLPVTLYGTIFRTNSEAAFSNMHLWLSSGHIFAMAYSSKLCTQMKLYILLVFLLFGSVLYGITEWKTWGQKPKASNHELPEAEAMNSKAADL